MKSSEAAMKKAGKYAARTLDDARKAADYSSEAARLRLREAGEELRGLATTMRENVRDRWVAGRARVAAAAGRCGSMVAEHPTAAVVGALGAGWVAGRAVVRSLERRA